MLSVGWYAGLSRAGLLSSQDEIILKGYQLALSGMFQPFTVSLTLKAQSQVAIFLRAGYDVKQGMIHGYEILLGTENDSSSVIRTNGVNVSEYTGRVLDSPPTFEITKTKYTLRVAQVQPGGSTTILELHEADLVISQMYLMGSGECQFHLFDRINITEGEARHAATLGFDIFQWNCGGGGKARRPGEYKDRWDILSPGEKEAAEMLGFTKEKWDRQCCWDTGKYSTHGNFIVQKWIHERGEQGPTLAGKMGKMRKISSTTSLGSDGSAGSAVTGEDEPPARYRLMHLGTGHVCYSTSNNVLFSTQCHCCSNSVDDNESPREVTFEVHDSDRNAVNVIVHKESMHHHDGHVECKGVILVSKNELDFAVAAEWEWSGDSSGRTTYVDVSIAPKHNYAAITMARVIQEDSIGYLQWELWLVDLKLGEKFVAQGKTQLSPDLLELGEDQVRATGPLSLHGSGWDPTSRFYILGVMQPVTQDGMDSVRTGRNTSVRSGGSEDSGGSELSSGLGTSVFGKTLRKKAGKAARYNFRNSLRVYVLDAIILVRHVDDRWFDLTPYSFVTLNHIDEKEKSRLQAQRDFSCKVSEDAMGASIPMIHSCEVTGAHAGFASVAFNDCKVDHFHSSTTHPDPCRPFPWNKSRP